MAISVNQETVNDTAKLMMHRLVSRRVGHDPSIVESAKASHARMAQRYVGYRFVLEWDGLLRLPLVELRARLISKDSEMVRLRLSSPFFLADGVDFTDYDFRLRIRRAARRIVERGLARRSRGTASVS